MVAGGFSSESLKQACADIWRNPAPADGEAFPAGLVLLQRVISPGEFVSFVEELELSGRVAAMPRVFP